MLALASDLPCTFGFRGNTPAVAALVGPLRAGGTLGVPVERVMLVGIFANGLSSRPAADAPTLLPALRRDELIADARHELLPLGGAGGSVAAA